MESYTEELFSKSRVKFFNELSENGVELSEEQKDVVYNALNKSFWSIAIGAQRHFVKEAKRIIMGYDV